MNRLNDDIASLGDIVTVWAHPDDETYLAGGLMAKARALGARVTCVVATDGDYADSAAERARVGRLRRSELYGALCALDVHDLELLHLPDGACADVEAGRAIDAIAGILSSRAPATVITFGPDGFTGHADHRAVSAWTVAAAQLAAPDSCVLHPTLTAARLSADRDIVDRFPIFDDGLPLTHDDAALAFGHELRGRWLDTKIRALRCHDSQTRRLIDSIGLTRYRRWVAEEFFVHAVTR